MLLKLPKVGKGSICKKKCLEVVWPNFYQKCQNVLAKWSQIKHMVDWRNAEEQLGCMTETRCGISRGKSECKAKDSGPLQSGDEKERKKVLTGIIKFVNRGRNELCTWEGMGRGKEKCAKCLLVYVRKMVKYHHYSKGLKVPVEAMEGKSLCAM